jgi:hypothetical protein
MLDHYVVFQPHRGREEELSTALRDFAGDITGLTCLKDFSWGENTNASGLKHGYTHGCYARLTGEAALRGGLLEPSRPSEIARTARRALHRPLRARLPGQRRRRCTLTPLTAAGSSTSAEKEASRG